jgi:hypothetical protein
MCATRKDSRKANVLINRQKRGQCECVEVKIKFDTKGNYWYYDIVTLLHNHKLHPESRMVHFMRSPKIWRMV